MAHGVPDDSDVIKQGDVYRVTDLAELAARLRSMVSYDRYGDVVLLDDFTDGLQMWESSGTGGTNYVRLTSTMYLSGGVAVMLVPGAAAGSFSQIAITFSPLLYGPVGVSIAFRFYPVIDALRFEYFSYDGIGLYRYVIVYNVREHTLAYLNSDNNYTVFDTDVDLTYSKMMFHRLKLVVNTLTGTYIRLYINNLTYVFDDVKCYYQGSSEFSNERFIFNVWGYAPYTGYCVIDNLVLTQNECIS